MLEERLQITWLNVYRVRRLCKLAHGYDPILEGWDQKPFHFNESGSAQRKTLHWRGVPEVPLKECASAVRSRWTATTYASTNPDRFTEYPPLEVLFKGGTVVEQRLDDMLIRLCAGGDQGELSFFTAQVGPKGSYRTDHVIEFLRRHLEPASPGRDWRIVMADFYGPHADTTVFELCWAHQYVLILIGGGVTGVLQVMDTHLHYSLSQRYTELEMLDLLEQERAKPHGCPTRSRESCCRDLLAAWRHAPLHEMGRRGWYDNCLANALDGSQDHVGRGAAGEMWDQMGMKDFRAQALADVDAEWAAGRLRWRDVQRLIEPFPKRGQLDTLVEGQDDEGDPGELEGGAMAWDDAVGLSDDDLDVDHGAALAAPISAQEAVGIHLSLAQQQSMALAREQLIRLQDIREKAKDFPHPRVLQMIDGILHQFKRKALGSGQTDAEIASTLRAAVVGDEERARAAQAAALAAAQLSVNSGPPPKKRQRVQRAVSRVPTAAARTHDLVAHTRRWLGNHVQLHLPREFNAGDLGQGRCAGGGEKYYKNRFELFVRVVNRFGNIDPTIENNIDRQFRRIDAHRRRNRFGWTSESYGSLFRDEMQSLLKAFDRGETSALADWIKRWITKAGVGSEITV